MDTEAAPSFEIGSVSQPDNLKVADQIAVSSMAVSTTSNLRSVLERSIPVTSNFGLHPLFSFGLFPNYSAVISKLFLFTAVSQQEDSVNSK